MLLWFQLVYILENTILRILAGDPSVCERSYFSLLQSRQLSPSNNISTSRPLLEWKVSCIVGLRQAKFVKGHFICHLPCPLAIPIICNPNYTEDIVLILLVNHNVPCAIFGNNFEWLLITRCHNFLNHCMQTVSHFSIPMHLRCLYIHISVHISSQTWTFYLNATVRFSII